jgi:hypothetical protein
MRSMALLSLVCLALAFPALAQTDDAIALQFYPELLRADALKFSDEPVPPVYHHVRGDLTGAGSQFLVVAYSNGRAGALRVIDVRATPVLVGENLSLIGSMPKVELFDLDRDGRMEIIVLLAAMRTDFTSLFKWTSSGLDLWGPTKTNHRGIERTVLPTIDYADLDGDGMLELIEENDPESGILMKKVYRLSGGDYVSASPAVFHAQYVRSTGKPEKVTNAFRVPQNGAGRWILRIVNGDYTGANAVTAGDIRVNGVTLVTSDKLKQKTRTISVPVVLGADNTIEVELRGDPGATLTVAFLQE